MKSFGYGLSSFIIFLVLLTTCNTTEPPDPPQPDNRKITLTLEDVSCTEVWLTLETENISLPAEINILQDDSISHISVLSTKDSLLYIDSLLPNQTYTFKAELSSVQNPILSNEISVNTLDTTTQNFTFEFFEFGDGGSSSYFNDVWIFDANNIWAVGYISPEDTTINGVHITNPNIIKWDGESWKLQPFSGTSSGIDGIWAVDTSLIYFASGGLRKYQNGGYSNIVVQGNWTAGQRVQKLWGSSENNIYGVGPAGTIVHYDGQTWKKIEFDTQWYFYEITGNKETGISYAVATNPSSDCIVVKLENSSPSIFYRKSQSEIKIYSNTLTELNNYIYIPNISGQNSIYRLGENTGKPEIIYQITGSFGIEQSSAVSSNDIYYFGPDLSGIGVWLLHFNGISYKMIPLPSIDRDNLGSLYAIKDLAVSVGYSNNKGYIIIIKRG